MLNVAFILTLDAKVVFDLTSKLVTLVNNIQLLCGLESRGTILEILMDYSRIPHFYVEHESMEEEF